VELEGGDPILAAAYLGGRWLVSMTDASDRHQPAIVSLESTEALQKETEAKGGIRFTNERSSSDIHFRYPYAVVSRLPIVARQLSSRHIVRS
jgi:hypothetical protein